MLLHFFALKAQILAHSLYIHNEAQHNFEMIFCRWSFKNSTHNIFILNSKFRDLQINTVQFMTAFLINLDETQVVCSN